MAPLRSNNPDMFVNQNARRRRFRHPKRWALILCVLLLIVAVVVAAVLVVGSGGGDKQPATMPAQSGPAAIPDVPTNTAPEVPGMMIPYDGTQPQGTESPSQTIYSFNTEFYSTRSAPAAMRYLTPNTSYKEEFIQDNMDRVQPGTKAKMYVFPTEKTPDKPVEGVEPRIFLSTLVLTTPTSEVFVYAQQFTIVKVEEQYRIQDWGTISS